MRTRSLLVIATVLVSASASPGGVGDPQTRTNHIWYPGELACSTFERLFATEAEAFRHATGARPSTDEQKALAAWLWRSAHYYHCEEGAEDLWGKGFGKGADGRAREYWTGMFAHGFGLCGTTHSQWVAEMEALFGHNRGRTMGVNGHNTFEVFLTGGAYGPGKWVLLDQDQSTLVWDPQGKALLSMAEVARDWKRLTSRKFAPERQHGWPVCGFDQGDATTYSAYNTAEYLSGYSGPPPLVYLRRGETLRRYLQPGLEDGKTFAFWGRNFNNGGIGGPERPQTWVNQPDKILTSTKGASFRSGQARYGNAVYTYKPNFANGDYKEGVIQEDDKHVVFEFYTPYIIAATPPNAKAWGIYEPGCKNGLVLHGTAACGVAVSTDQGKTWQDCGKLADGLDLTDRVKGRRQYLLRFDSGAAPLAERGVTMTTVCQANAAMLPRLTDNGSDVSFQTSRQALISAGPNLPQADAHVVEGKHDTPRVTLELTPPRGEQAVALYAAAHVLSSSPPRPEIKYQIEASTDGGKSWQPVVKDWTITRRGDEPRDFWSQSMCWGTLKLATPHAGPVRIRFRNDGGKRYARTEAHLVYRPRVQDATRVTYAWADNGGAHQASHLFAADEAAPWHVGTGKKVQTLWVEYEPVSKR
jgi:hypothetical protein